MSTTPSQVDLFNTAIAFYRQGIVTVPTTGGTTAKAKAPLGAWKHYQSNLPTVAELKKMFLDTPQQGIGVIAGAVSSNLECLEIEGRASDAGMLSQVNRILHESGHGELWETIMNGYCERSPSGGMHWFYKISGAPVPSNTKLARDESGEVLAETRSEGGFMITAPSASHTSGSEQPYELLNGSIETIPTITWEQREIIASAFRQLDHHSNAPARFEQVVNQSSNHSQTHPEPVVNVPSDQSRAGDDFDAKTSWDELLTGYGWTRGTTRDGTTEWTRPNKSPADGMSATTDHIDGRMYVFSTSTPLPNGQPLKKWHVYAFMEHGGDFSAAARQLRADGFGSNVPALNQFSALPAIPPQGGQADEPATADSWLPIDWDVVMDENREPKMPTMLMRNDGVALLYPNSYNGIFGESESGKSMVAAYLISERIKRFNETCLILDYERDANEWRDRLKLFRCTDEQIRRNLIYIHPDTTPTESFWQFLKTKQIQLCVIDSFSGAMATFGGDSNSNDACWQFTHALPYKVIKHTGACVLIIDHQNKNADTRGRFATGSQAKIATITGAYYEASMTEPMGIGLRGSVRLKVSKDAAGGALKQHTGIEKPKRLFEMSNIVFDSTDPEKGIQVEVLPPSGIQSNRPTTLMEQTSQILEQHPDGLTQNRLYQELGKSRGNAAIERAWNLLAAENYIREQQGANNSITRYSVKPYRQVSDPQSDRFNGQQILNAFIPNE